MLVPSGPSKAMKGPKDRETLEITQHRVVQTMDTHENCKIIVSWMGHELAARAGYPTSCLMSAGIGSSPRRDPA